MFERFFPEFPVYAMMDSGIFFLYNRIYFILEFRIISVNSVSKERQYIIQFICINTVEFLRTGRHKFQKAKQLPVLNDRCKDTAPYILVQQMVGKTSVTRIGHFVGFDI